METTALARATDESGYPIFAAGGLGAAHVRAHRALDRGERARGYAELGGWLAQNPFEPALHDVSDWAHLEWHMLVFELSVGRWHDAHHRFQRALLPVAASTSLALTDAPAALWRLRLAADREVALPWTPIAETARRNLGASDYVELHNLLALAGARDAAGLDAWIARSRGAPSLLTRWARGLCAFACGDYAVAAHELEGAAEGTHRLGGSRAQNELFAAIQGHVLALAECPPTRRAA